MEPPPSSWAGLAQPPGMLFIPLLGGKTKARRPVSDGLGFSSGLHLASAVEGAQGEGGGGGLLVQP